jgi:hypothetical protein
VYHFALAMTRRLTIFAALLLLLVAAGCGDDRPKVVPATRPVEAALDVQLKPLTPLLPNRPTHATVDGFGNVYWVQETDRRDDTMFVIGEGGIPRATQLAAANIAALLGAKDVKDAARGNIHGIAAAPEAGGDIYFYFVGVQARRTIACIGAFTPKTERVRILADTDAVAAATGMGRSLPLARGSVVCDGRIVWMWLRHTDNWAMFRIEPGRLPTSGPAKLPRAFESVRLEGRPLELTREDMEIAPAPGGALFLLDIAGGRLVKIAPDGTATIVRSLAGLPKLLSTPAVDRDQNLVLFAGNGEIIGVKGQDANVAATPEKLDSTYPALLIFKPDKVVSIGRDHMHAYPGFPIFSTRLRQLVPHPRDGGWISYDAGSGELLHVRTVENLWR